MAIPSPEQTTKTLDKEPKVKVKIRNEKNNPNYTSEAVYVNGVCYQIPVGEYVEVPQTIANMLEEKGII